MINQQNKSPSKNQLKLLNFRCLVILNLFLHDFRADKSKAFFKQMQKFIDIFHG